MLTAPNICVAHDSFPIQGSPLHGHGSWVMSRDGLAGKTFQGTVLETPRFLHRHFQLLRPACIEALHHFGWKSPLILLRPTSNAKVNTKSCPQVPHPHTF